ncbi:MAG TPA: hypothetical protein VIT21_02675 [Chthoniobacterales bacterium]
MHLKGANPSRSPAPRQTESSMWGDNRRNAAHQHTLATFLEGENGPAFFPDRTTREPEAALPALPRTRFTLVRQFNHYGSKTLKAEAIAREQNVFRGMDLDPHVAILIEHGRAVARHLAEPVAILL